MHTDLHTHTDNLFFFFFGGGEQGLTMEAGLKLSSLKCQHQRSATVPGLYEQPYCKACFRGLSEVNALCLPDSRCMDIVVFSAFGIFLLL